jgi:hypothetical protein
VKAELSPQQEAYSPQASSDVTCRTTELLGRRTSEKAYPGVTRKKMGK